MSRQTRSDSKNLTTRKKQTWTYFIVELKKYIQISLLETVVVAISEFQDLLEAHDLLPGQKRIDHDQPKAQVVEQVAPFARVDVALLLLDSLDEEAKAGQVIRVQAFGVCRLALANLRDELVADDIDPHHHLLVVLVVSDEDVDSHVQVFHQIFQVLAHVESWHFSALLYFEFRNTLNAKK